MAAEATTEEGSPSPPEVEDEHDTPADPLEGIVEFSLGTGLFEREIAVRVALRNYTESAFKDLWDRGQYQEVQSVTSSMLKSEDGRPRPCETKSAGSMTRIVCLSEEEHAIAWVLMQALRDIEAEKLELTNEAFGR